MVEHEQGHPQGYPTIETHRTSTISTNLWSTHIHHSPVPSTRTKRNDEEKIKDINGLLLAAMGGAIGHGGDTCDSTEKMGNNTSQLTTYTIKHHPTAIQEQLDEFVTLTKTPL